MAWTAKDFEDKKQNKWSADDFSSGFAQPKVEPTPPPKPTLWDNVKSTAGKVGNFIAEPFKSTPLLPSKEGLSTLSKPKLESPIANTIAESPVGKAGKWLGDNLQAGVGDYSNAFYKTLQSVGGDKVPGLNKLLDYGVQATEQYQSKGGTDIPSQVVRSIPGAAQNMALALMSGGASTAGQIAKTGSEAIRQASLQMLKNPAFINSALRSYGGAYGEARDAGASRLQGISAGIQQAIPQAMIEQSGGIEQLPNRTGQSLLKNIGRSALEEAGEEILQYPFEGLAKKATYAPNTPLFSTKEQAIVNPLQMGQAGLVGGLAGGLLGGVGGAFNSAFNTQANVDTTVENQPAYQPPSDNVFYADPYGNVTKDSDFKPFLQLPPGPDFQMQVDPPVSQTDFYTDPYGHTRAELAPLQLQLPAPAVPRTNPEISSKFAELDKVGSRISEIQNDPLTIIDSEYAAELDAERNSLQNQRSRLENELQGEKYQRTDERFSNIDELDSSALDDLAAESQDVMDSIVNKHIEFLKMTSGQGVTQGTVHRDFMGEVVGRQGRVSNNEKWYQDWAKENGYKKLSQKDILDIAEKHLTEGVDTLSAGFIPPNQNYLYGKDLLNYINMRKNLMNDAPYVANRNIDTPSRVMPGEMERLQGLDVRKQSDSLSMLKPPIAEPDYQAAAGQTETPTRIFPGERITPLEEMLKPLSNMQHPAFASPVDSNVRIEGKNPFDVFQTSQEPFTGVQQDIQPNTQTMAETAASVESEITAQLGTPEYKTQYRQKLRSEADALLNNSDNAKDKVGWKQSRETMERNNLDIFGEESGKKINEAIFRPVHDNEAKKTKFINKYVDRVKSLNLSKTESEYVQKLGEGKIKESDLPVGMDREKIKNAISEFRKMYDGFLNLANTVLVQNGYAPVEYRKDYFPHFDSPNDPFVKAMKAMGFKVDNITLPTDIAGITHQFRPGKKWFGNFLRRTGDKTTFNALEGFERYLYGISDVIYHTNDIQRLRAFETSIRSKYADENIRNRIAEIESSDLSADEQQTAIDALFQMDRGHLGNYVTNLRNYTDNLAGKKSIEDRNMEHQLGRATYNFFDNVNMQVSRNMVGWNAGSWLTNFIPIAQAGGGIKTKNLLKATQDTVFNYINDDGFKDKSTFLTNRGGTERLTRSTIQKIGDIGMAPMEFIDDISTQILTRGKYLDNIERGMSHQEAINNADDYTAGAVADRSKGALPTIFNTRNPLTKLFTLFQVEVNNQYSFLFKDLPRESKELGTKWLARTLLKAAVGSFLYNELYEKMTGRRPTIDLIGTVVKALKQDTPLSAIQSVAEDVLDQTPFIGGLMGGGRLPTQAALPEFGKMWDAAKGIQEDGFTRENVGDLASAALKNPLTYLVSPIGGGGQAKKVYEGMKAYNQGASISDTGRMRFPIEQTPGSRIKTTLFGQYAAPEAREYFDENRRPLSEKQTQQVMSASDPKTEFERVHNQRQINKLQQEIKDVAKNRDLSMGERDKRIMELRLQIEQLRTAR